MKKVAGGSCCSYKNVWGRAQDGNGGDDSEGRKDDEAKPVDDHGGKLPVADHLIFFLLHLHPVRDKLELLQDALKFPIGGVGSSRRCRIGVCMEERGGGRQTGLAVSHAPSISCGHTASIVTVGKLGAAGGGVGLQRVAIHSDETCCPIDPCHRHGSGRKQSFIPDVLAIN